MDAIQSFFPIAHMHPDTLFPYCSGYRTRTRQHKVCSIIYNAIPATPQCRLRKKGARKEWRSLRFALLQEKPKKEFLISQLHYFEHSWCKLKNLTLSMKNLKEICIPIFYFEQNHWMVSHVWLSYLHWLTRQVPLCTLRSGRFLHRCWGSRIQGCPAPVLQLCRR